MDAEQVNQDGAQDALDAGQQNTSDLDRPEPAVQETAPETLTDARGDVVDEPAPGEPAGTSQPVAEPAGEPTETDVLDVPP
ncbi:MAG: hypothetical protein ACOC84_08085, partial [Actinomycetota bacterium]